MFDNYDQSVWGFTRDQEEIARFAFLIAEAEFIDSLEHINLISPKGPINSDDLNFVMKISEVALNENNDDLIEDSAFKEYLSNLNYHSDDLQVYKIGEDYYVAGYH